MKEINRLLLEISNKQFQINAAESKHYTRQYRKERQLLEKELFYLISQTSEDMSKIERQMFMAEVTPLIQDSVTNLGAWEQYKMSDDLKRVYEGIYIDTGTVIGSGLKTGASFTVINPLMIETALSNTVKGKNFSDRVWRNKVKLADRVYEDVYQAIREGTDIRELSRILAKDFDTGTYNAMRLLQNETARVINEAQDEIYRQSDVVEEVLYTATLDDRTTDICQDLDGETYDKNDDNKPKIPEDTHVGCRSTYVPIVKGWSPTIRHDNLRKENIDYVKFTEWK